MRIHQAPPPSYWEATSSPQPHGAESRHDGKSHAAGSVAADSANPKWPDAGVYARRSTPFGNKLIAEYRAAREQMPHAQVPYAPMQHAQMPYVPMMYVPMTYVPMPYAPAPQVIINNNNFRRKQTSLLPYKVFLNRLTSSGHASRMQYDIRRFLNGLRSSPGMQGASMMPNQESDWKAGVVPALKPMFKLVSGAFRAFGQSGFGEGSSE